MSLYCAVAHLLLGASATRAQQFQPIHGWPLCGRITESPPAGWNEAHGCPGERRGSSDHTDLPLTSTFGPRLLVNAGGNYDFHRGIDIPTPAGTPVFAVAAGLVKIAGQHSGYSDPLVQLRHYRADRSRCGDVGCYYSLYMHLSSWTVSSNQWVEAGELIGYTGASVSGTEHLHFEIRNSPAFDVYSRWNRDAIHPLQVLPYSDSTVPSVVFTSVEIEDPSALEVELRVSTTRPDLQRIEIVVYDEQLQVVEQSGNTPDALGYHVYPAFFDPSLWNFEYSHKDSADWPWESFGAGSAAECPYHEDHFESYSSGVHLESPAQDDPQVGDFNGLRVAPEPFVSATGTYTSVYAFRALSGAARCIEARLSDSQGGVHSTWWEDCASQRDGHSG